MIELEFGPADLAGLRFAHSPMAEVVASVFALRGGVWPHTSWRSRVTPMLQRWPTLRAVLLGPRGYAPDFLTPVPRRARPTLDEELAVVAATPLDVVVEQVTAARPGLEWFARDPRTSLGLLLTEIRAYFDAAIAPVWTRLRSAAEAEVAARSRDAADRGARALVEALHPRLAWDGSALLIRYPDKHGRWGLGGPDLTLLPTGFAGDHVYALHDEPGCRALWYAPRGFGNLWTPAPEPSAALAGLLGPTRAAVLTLLAAPHSTGQVADRLGLAAGTASHHLTTLRDAGLIAAGREGRRLLYQRTRLGDDLTTG
ncbi:helix-turn-helix domain-containing protein [Actinoplanes aureus]|uniref:Winged helix-turn-helix transcriptional regulator n=1 Tax=Actinoplanes aureus TaxID=2792083 RepID=A0A931C0Q9_9ACTN|nr:helix-turn-helix domain-containing protein [Actinoplanes aureus]MBG0561155.1 winged helix-turn-helix transcriptional regulator [Actinoplanes aureus]